MIELGTIQLHGASAVYDARNKIRGLAQALGYDSVEATRLATAVSAAVRVMRRTAREPRIAVSLASEHAPPQLVLDFEARGAAPELSILDGFCERLSRSVRLRGQRRVHRRAAGAHPEPLA
jgi:hypothetical protein